MPVSRPSTWQNPPWRGKSLRPTGKEENVLGPYGHWSAARVPVNNAPLTDTPIHSNNETCKQPNYKSKQNSWKQKGDKLEKQDRWKGGGQEPGVNIIKTLCIHVWKPHPECLYKGLCPVLTLTRSDLQIRRRMPTWASQEVPQTLFARPVLLTHIKKKTLNIQYWFFKKWFRIKGV